MADHTLQQLGWVVRPGGVHVFVGNTFPEPDDDALAPYRFTGVPVYDRPRPTCGRPGSGRGAHTRNGELCCDLCNHAEREYNAARRALAKQEAS